MKVYNFFLITFGSLLLIVGCSVLASDDSNNSNSNQKSFPNKESVHDFTVLDINGDSMKLSQFEGKKLLIVNTASECGFTPQYEGLEKLYQDNKDNLTIVGFPANNFGGQEPGSDDEIKQFCKKNYGVSFPMASKVSVKGDDQHRLFQWLTAKENPDFTGDIKWNFEKFLIDENGKLIHRFRSMTKPNSKKITNNI